MTLSETAHIRTAVQVAEALVEALTTIDPAKLQELIDPAVQVIEPPSLPCGGVYEGADAFFGELMPALTGPFEINITNAKVFDGGQSVACSMTLMYTSRRTGSSITMPYVELYDVHAGRITKMDVYPKDAAALADWMNSNG